MKARCILAFLSASFLAEAHPGSGIIALSENSVLTGDAVQSRLWRFEVGVAPTHLTGSLNFHCHWVTRGLNGLLYAETLTRRQDRWMDTLYRLDAQGANPKEMASGEEGTFGVFAVGRSGEVVRQVGSQIRVGTGPTSVPFRASGRVAPGDPPLAQVRAYAWGTGDVLYLADGPRVRRIGADGVVRVVATVGGNVTNRLYAGAGRSVQIWGLAVDGRGRLIVAVPSKGELIRIEPNGSSRVISRADNGWAAIGAATFGDTVFMLETKTQGNQNFGPRVRALRVDGRIDNLGSAS